MKEELNLSSLIEALNIFLKYNNALCPTHCEHDILMIVGISEEEVSEEDIKRLDELSFFRNTEYDVWASYHFGSA